MAPDPFAIDPVAERDMSDLQPVLFSLGWLTLNAEPTYLEPSHVPGPSKLNNEPMPAPRKSGYEPPVGKSTVTTFIIVFTLFLLLLLAAVLHLCLVCIYVPEIYQYLHVACEDLVLLL